MFSREQLKRAASLTEEDFVQLGKCRRPHNRLGFAYQVALVRLFDRFPQQQPFELLEELVCFSAGQLGLDAGLIELYRKRQPKISEHQQAIADYLRLRPFDDAAVTQLELGNPREFLQAEKEDQEMAEACKRLIKNCIICWNYLYLSQKLEDSEDTASREAFLEAVANGSAVSW